MTDVENGNVRIEKNDVGYIVLKGLTVDAVVLINEAFHLSPMNTVNLILSDPTEE